MGRKNIELERFSSFSFFFRRNMKIRGKIFFLYGKIMFCDCFKQHKRDKEMKIIGTKVYLKSKGIKFK